MLSTSINVATLPYAVRLQPCGLRNLKSRSLCPHPGQDAEILLFVLKNLGLGYKLFPFDFRDPSTYKNGSADDALFRGDVELIVPSQISTELRRRYFSFSHPIAEASIVFLTSAAEETLVANAALLFRVFDGCVWVSLLVCCAILCALIAGRKYFMNLQLRATNLAPTVIGFGTVLFLNLFAGGLLSQLLHPVVSHQIGNVWDMVDLIEKREIRLAVAKNGLVHQSIRDSQHQFFRKLSAALENNPLEHDWSVLFGHQGKKFVRGVLDTDVPLYKHQCDTRVIGQNARLPKYPLSFMMRQNSTLLPILNGALIRHRAHTRHILDKYKHLVDDVYRCDKVEIELQPLGLVPLSGAFIVLFSAAVLCTICLVVECGVNRVQSTDGRDIVNVVEEEDSSASSILENVTVDTDAGKAMNDHLSPHEQ